MLTVIIRQQHTAVADDVYIILRMTMLAKSVQMIHEDD